MIFFKKLKFGLVKVVSSFIFVSVILNFCGLCFLKSAYAAYNFGGVSARKGAILIDSRTGDVLYEQNADQLALIASLTKIFTTSIVLERCENLDEKFVVDSKAIQVEGTSMGLRPGDVVTMRDLCYGMMLASGNDAANAAAVRLCGSIPAFVDLMNATVKELGLKNTIFKTPSGLDCDPSDGSRIVKDISKFPHSTAREVALFIRKAFKNEIFKEICSLKKVRLKFGNPPAARTIYNHNKLLRLYDEACCGVKTGFTKKAGRCLASAARKDGVELIAVVLNDPNDWDDSKRLLKYGFSQFREYDLPNDFSHIRPQVLCEDESELKVRLKEPVRMFLTKKMTDTRRLTTKVRYVSSLFFAPVYKGEKVGEVEYYLDEKLIKKSDLVSSVEILQ